MNRLSGESSTATGGGSDMAINPLGAILAAITNSQSEMHQLREDLRAAQEEAEEKAGRKAERPYRFQKKAHEEQATFNDSLRDHLVEAESQLLRAARVLDEGPAKQALENAKQTLEKAKQSLKRGKDALAHRTKTDKSGGSI